MTESRAGTRPCPQPEPPSGRRLRAAAFALLSTALAAAGHPLATGDPVSWQRAAGGTVCVLALSWLVTAGSRPWWHVVTATGLAQLVLHRALSVPQPMHHGPAGAHGAGPHVVSTAQHGVWVMVTAHGLAACLMALLMYRADRALSRLPDLVGRWAHGAVATAAAAFGLLCRPWLEPRLRTGPVPLDGPPVPPPVARMLCDAVVRRGPPVRGAEDAPLIPVG
ncbi:hypothetical protein ACQKM2_06650 [Streptomyces sp. NPDC004126]|uniref:hypothetical protein n=1 Tax=Streptomyces sp. NPDC004126 TaxID=3390695 RepID=UPI003D09467E